ncbi:GNAT family N-acetyltransferase [Paraliobacillus salinarum]|uniref:GNAT family N-acetyltransferase n=1 Tax=Paraliobacillus salinarum TaxID=1158996 RepID=UPI0015F460B7|nr:GNAT family protein [Paraliobacillus salinarum]
MKNKLIGNKIYIRQLQKDDATALLEINKENREIFNRYSPVDKEDAFFTLESHEEMIEVQQQDWSEDRQYGFGIFINETDQLVGTVNLFFVERNVGDKCMIGYSLDYRYTGQGYMTEAVHLAVIFAFQEAGFHRIEAGVMPRNTGSIHVLENCGFTREGTLRDELKINGTYEDHHIYSRLSTDK